MVNRTDGHYLRLQLLICLIGASWCGMAIAGQEVRLRFIMFDSSIIERTENAALWGEQAERDPHH